MYTFDQLKEDVRKEAEALKVHATKEELGKLNLEKFDGSDFSECVYGQMTGTCASQRANQLIAACCPLYIDNESYSPHDDELDNVRVINPLSSEDTAMSRHNAIDYVLLRYISPIEAYIMRPEAQNANLIAYLKGESETLEL